MLALLLNEFFGTLLLSFFTILTFKLVKNRVLRYFLQGLSLFIIVLVANELKGKGFVNPLIALVILIPTNPIEIAYVIPTEFAGFIIGFLLTIKIKKVVVDDHKINTSYLWVVIFLPLWLFPIAIGAKYHFDIAHLNYFKAAAIASGNLFLTKLIFYKNEVNLHNPIFATTKLLKRNKYEIISFCTSFAMAIGIGLFILYTKSYF